jgi:quinolinate synthase
LIPFNSLLLFLYQFLDPDPDVVATLRDGLLKTNMGIVAHYYMDVELQGVLQALKHSHPDLTHRIGIADSLKMGDLAVDMCQNHNVSSVVCLGVDFMAESVQAILSKNNLSDIPVYRATSQPIGCSLAESAEGDMYRAWLQHESAVSSANDQPSLHVIYINTSLETKAICSSILPTITCTSSNVLQTLLQAAHQIPDIRILYGPDTYMGDNLRTLLDVLLTTDLWDDEKIAKDLHPQHTRATLQTLHDNLIVFPQGNCIVHHMFGSEVTNTIRQEYYDDCYMTAHLEVPGEMFEIAMEKSLQDKGVVGSTSDILNFITRKVKDASDASNGDKQRLKFVLGTEAGMVTSIVQNVQSILQETGSRSVEAEIIFPVSSEAVMSTDNDNNNNNDSSDTTNLALVPGVAGGEGCSTAGGCATCPFMKMNDLDRLSDLIDMVHTTQTSSSSSSSTTTATTLKGHLPPDRLRGKSIDGVDATDLGTQAILYMRTFMQTQQLPDELVQAILKTNKKEEPASS